MIRNLITALYNADTITSTEDKVRTLKSLVNALTAATCSAMMTHCFRVKRGELGGVDERNELDAEIRGDELRDESMDNNGYDVVLSAYKTAQICDGIRHHLYDQLHAYGEFETDTALFSTPAQDITKPVNWNQPMSVQMYMDTRTRNAGGVNPEEVAAIVKRRPSLSESTVRNILQEEALKSAKRMADIAPDVIAEIGSLEDNYTSDAFTTLPIDVQVRVAEHVARSFNRDYTRLLPRSLRDLEASGECDLIEITLKNVRSWINESEHLARVDAQRLAA